MPLTDQARTLASLAGECGRSLLTLRRNTVRHSPAPPEGGMVLDVGSGQAAHPRADLVVDKYVADDFERGSALDLRKPLVVADGQALPLAGSAFSYIVASHVLEHATDPVLFARELARVGHAGFVQVPSREAELTFGWPCHPWLIDRESDVLVFCPRGDAEAPVGTLFHEAFDDSTLFRSGSVPGAKPGITRSTGPSLSPCAWRARAEPPKLRLLMSSERSTRCREWARAGHKASCGHRCAVPQTGDGCAVREGAWCATTAGAAIPWPGVYRYCWPRRQPSPWPASADRTPLSPPPWPPR